LLACTLSPTFDEIVAKPVGMIRKKFGFFPVLREQSCS
jgi:hypothetical protein